LVEKVFSWGGFEKGDSRRGKVKEERIGGEIGKGEGAQMKI